MALSIQVLLHEVTNLTDARYAAGMGVELLSFPLDDGRVSKEEFIAITGWLEGPSFIGAFTQSTAEEILAAAAELELTYLQVSDPTLLAELGAFTGKTILKTSLETLKSNPGFQNPADFLLLEGEQPLTEFSQQEKASLEALNQSTDLLLDYPLGDAQIEEVIAEFSPAGIALKGGEEERPGYKDFDEIADVLEALEVD